MVRTWYPFKWGRSYGKWAVGLGISPEELKQHEYNRIDEIQNNILPPTKRIAKMKCREIKAKNPILIIGAGPSAINNLDKAKEFKGKIACVDVMFNTVIESGIIPDYLFLLEAAIRPAHFNHEYLQMNKDKILMIGSSIIHSSIKKLAEIIGISFERYINSEEIRCSNVGLFSIFYSKEKLQCDKIFLLGFEHEGDTWDQREYERWQYDFWYHIQKWPKKTIVNCCDGGKLYYEDYVLDSTLDSLELEDGN